ncbi:hypothetical protein HNR42_003493 [Deinobacterium chartae]|uniref:Intein C-terminal splicing domain-containing protein n=1 Tax=Deinobacterium chartae TaxID=521158 RepID=A0A841I6C6_9DEIO|nr:polymorphic toxin-type HINT domain-containing protein [Deinobacterium chartae]MBB6100028.1 hypothetical protein [Deinobacterium chartae]
MSDRWTGAGYLEVGDKIKQADGTTGVVKYVNTVSETRTMYNLEVQEAHTFFVGTQGWLVHNGGNGSSAPIVLYRAVSEAEYNNIVRTGKFSTRYGMGYEGKQFALSYEDAVKFAQGMDGKGDQAYTRIVATVVKNPNKVSMELAEVSDIDGGLKYYLAKDKALGKLKPVTDAEAVMKLAGCP